jgi:WD40 repeat protein
MSQSNLKKQGSDVSEKSSISSTMKTELSGNVVVIEKEFRNKKAHSGEITQLLKISDAEFVTSSQDNSFKVWDKDLQGCRYTIETHEQLHTMTITGEHMNFLVSGHGAQNFIVIGL